MSDALFHGDLVNAERILYTPSVFAKTNLLFLQEVGTLQAQQPHVSKRENLSSYLFFIVLSGSGQLQYNDITYPIKKGDCVFIDCKKPYFHKSSSDLWKLQWVHFNGNSLLSIYEKYIERGGQPCFHAVNPKQYSSIMKHIYDTASEDDYIRDMLINELLTSLLTLLMKESWHPELQKSRKTKYDLCIVKEYLDAHYTEKLTLDQLSNMFFINKYYMIRVFKTQFGMTINNYLLQKKINYAKQLLRFTDKRIETIGIDCGIGDIYYFSRVFKKAEGISPREYKKQW